MASVVGALGGRWWTVVTTGVKCAREAAPAKPGAEPPIPVAQARYALEPRQRSPATDLTAPLLAPIVLYSASIPSLTCRVTYTASASFWQPCRVCRNALHILFSLVAGDGCLHTGSRYIKLQSHNSRRGR